MRKSRFTNGQKADIIRELEAGASISALSSRCGVHANTIRYWRERLSRMNDQDAARLRELELSTLKMQRIITLQALKLDALEGILRKHGLAVETVSKSSAEF